MKYRDSFFMRRFRLSVLALGFAVCAEAAPSLPPLDTAEGYLARLLINEVPFPGERGYRSEADSMAAMEQMLLVVDRRLQRVPPPYSQRQVAAVTSDDIIDIITAGGEKGQFDGFFRDAAGKPATVPRVGTRIDNLFRIAGQGEPGRFVRMLQHAIDVAARYVEETTRPDDRHAEAVKAEGKPATGGSYAWMTDEVRFHPGGFFLRIDDQFHGGLGGNRFFTLEKDPPP